VTVDPRPSQIWIYDILRKSWTRLAGEKHSLEPLWAPDNRRVLFDTDGDLFSRPFDASTPAEMLLARPRPQYATSWSADGKILIFSETQVDSANKYDIWALPIGEEPRPLIRTPSNEGDGRLSPNGAWLAYQSDESGRMEIYVRPFPNVDERKVPISTSGGQRPVWSPDGRELFYGLGSAVYRVAIDARGSAFTAGPPEMLFRGPFDLLTTEFTIMPDGSRFLLVENDPNARPTQIQVVFNWEEELKRTRSRDAAEDRQFRLGKK
jgi:hypothetical protein